MHKIEVVKAPCEDAIFEIDKFAFKLTNNELGDMIKFQVELEIEYTQPIDIRLLLEDIDPNLEFLLETPKELTEYIKEHEENIDPKDECLFHDMRTKYIEIINIQKSQENEEQKRIMILGFSFYDGKVCFNIKVFSLKVLTSFWDQLTKYCFIKNINLTIPDDIRWIRLNQYLLKTNEEKSVGVAKDFLRRTLIRNHFSRFRCIFQQIDNDGYITRKFYNKIMVEKKSIGDGRDVEVPINQISKFFSPYWKYKVSTNGRGKEVLCLYDDMPIDDKIDDYVYSFKPNLMRYYLQYWFEDFTTEVIKGLSIPKCNIKYILPGKKFNFYCDGIDENIREIDLVVGIEKEHQLKLLAVECKKTLTNKEIQTTNKKCREKIIDSGNNVFDAFIHIGCFSNSDVNFEKKIQGTRCKFRQSIIEGTGDNTDAPYFAFDISSIDDFEKKLSYIIDDVFINW